MIIYILIESLNLRGLGSSTVAPTVHASPTTGQSQLQCDPLQDSFHSSRLEAVTAAMAQVALWRKAFELLSEAAPPTAVSAALSACAVAAVWEAALTWTQVQSF